MCRHVTHLVHKHVKRDSKETQTTETHISNEDNRDVSIKLYIFQSKGLDYFKVLVWVRFRIWKVIINWGCGSVVRKLMSI